MYRSLFLTMHVGCSAGKDAEVKYVKGWWLGWPEVEHNLRGDNWPGKKWPVESNHWVAVIMAAWRWEIEESNRLSPGKGKISTNGVWPARNTVG